MFDDKKQLIAYGLKDGSTVHYGFRPIIKRVKKPIIKKYKKPRKPKFQIFKLLNSLIYNFILNILNIFLYFKYQNQ